jgi:hypothetical protein
MNLKEYNILYMDSKEKYIKYKTKYLQLNNMIGGGNKDNKILFVMFQGGGTNLKSWNEYTESKFLNKLKKLGDVYTYQDKVYNSMHYDKNIPEHNDYDSNIDIDINYNNIDKHCKMVYSDIQKKYTNIDKYKLIPVGWSAGGYLALYFSQIYSNKCKMCILLDPVLVTPENIKLRLKSFEEDKKERLIYPITNRDYKILLNSIKKNKDDTWKKIITTSNYIRTKFISKYINIEFKIPVISFIYISKSDKNEYGYEFNNDTKLREIDILSKKNPKMYNSYIINSSHWIFNKKQDANIIISTIKKTLKT